VDITMNVYIQCRSLTFFMFFSSYFLFVLMSIGDLQQVHILNKLCQICWCKIPSFCRIRKCLLDFPCFVRIYLFVWNKCRWRTPKGKFILAFLINNCFLFSGVFLFFFFFFLENWDSYMTIVILGCFAVLLNGLFFGCFFLNIFMIIQL
jgi:hypothetical protein